MIEIKFKKLSENAIIPSYAHDGDVGLDLTAT
jgi:dUTPase